MFLETPEGIVELREDGTYAKHKVRFLNVNGKIFKEDLVTKDMTVVPPSVLLTVDETTGEIEGEQRGFVPDYELGAPVHPVAGKKYLKVYDSDIPIDFKSSVPTGDGRTMTVINYKFDIAGKLVKK